MAEIYGTMSELLSPILDVILVDPGQVVCPFYLIFSVSVLFSPCFSEPWNLPFHIATKVFLLISVQIPFNKGEKAVSLVQCICGCEFTVINYTVMLWKKASAVVGLAVLTPREAAKGALLCEDFQKMLDPFGDVIREVKVSTAVYFLMYSVTL